MDTRRFDDRTKSLVTPPWHATTVLLRNNLSNGGDGRCEDGPPAPNSGGASTTGYRLSVVGRRDGPSAPPMLGELVGWPFAPFFGGVGGGILCADTTEVVGVS